MDGFGSDWFAEFKLCDMSTMREGWERAMKINGMRIAGVLTACLLGLVTLAQPGRLMAQAAAPAPAATPGAASVHGHVNDPLGVVPVPNGEVRLTTDRNLNTVNKKFEYTFPVDNSGNYKGSDIKPGNYDAWFYQNNNSIDRMPSQVFAAGEDKTVDFDMSRKEYIDKMSPAERDQMEQTRKQNAEIIAKNAKIENLNALLKQARADTAAGNYASSIKSMTEATAAKPDEPILWDTLGDAQLGDAVAADKAAKAAKTTDPSIPDKLTAAVTSYQKALSLNAASAKPSTDVAAVVNNQLGQALGRLGKTQDAEDAYDAAAKADPKGAARYYYNEAVTLYNAGLATGKVDGVAEAADKAIAADPTRADAYYLKTQGLAPLITATADGKLVAPPGFVDACNKYLQLAPAGPHVADIKALLAGLNEQIQTNYKAPPPPKRK
jgi:tetratricopeptide (TPR) repeat protein